MSNDALPIDSELACCSRCSSANNDEKEENPADIRITLLPQRIINTHWNKQYSAIYDLIPAHRVETSYKFCDIASELVSNNLLRLNANAERTWNCPLTYFWKFLRFRHTLDFLLTVKSFFQRREVFLQLPQIDRKYPTSFESAFLMHHQHSNIDIYCHEYLASSLASLFQNNIFSLFDNGILSLVIDVTAKPKEDSELDFGVNRCYKANDTSLIFSPVCIIKYLRLQKAMLQDQLSTALFNAIVFGAFHLVKSLCRYGAEVNMKHSGDNGELRDGDTPLMVALNLNSGDSAIYRYLLQVGADVNATNSSGDTALHCAARNTNYYEAVRLLSERGADANAGNWAGQTALHLFALKGDLPTTALLIEKCGADLSLSTFDGNRPLHVATSQGHYNLVQYLLECGADVNSTNHYGYTPLIIAANNGYVNVVKIILTYRPAVNARLQDGDTALHQTLEGFKLFCDIQIVSTAENYLTICQLLLEHGAHIDIPGRYGVVLEILSGCKLTHIVSRMRELFMDKCRIPLPLYCLSAHECGQRNSQYQNSIAQLPIVIIDFVNMHQGYKKIIN